MTAWKPDPQTYGQALHEIGCLEQQVADLQEQLAEAHKTIAAVPALLEALQGAILRCESGTGGYVGTDGQFIKTMRDAVAMALTHNA